MYRHERKIPTLLALFILFAGLGVAVYGDTVYRSYQSNAATSATPTDIHFTNVTEHSFTVSWSTDKPAIGSLTVSGNGQKLTLVDDLDTDGIARVRTVHAITAQNLSPNGTYQVQIIGSGRCAPTTCPSLSQKTAAKEAVPTNLTPLRGTVQTADSKPADGALVFVTVGKSLPLSTRADSAGLWVVQLSALRGQDLSDHLAITDADIIQISVKRAAGESTTAVLDVKSLKGNVPLPPLQFGKSYNLIGLVSKRQDVLAQQQTSQTLGVTSQRVGAASNGLDLLFPKSDFDTTSDTRPRFRGIAPAKTKIRISLDADAQAGTVTVAADGTWNSRPTKALIPGTHKITIQGLDREGKPVSLTRQFIVLKSGEQVLGESTPSASLTPTGAPGTVSPTPTGQVSISPTPEATVSATPILLPTVSVTASPTVAPVVTPLPTTPVESQPRSGAIAPTVIVLGGGAGFLALAALLLFWL